MQRLTIYAAATEDCERTPLLTFELTGPVWTGDSVTLPFDPAAVGDIAGAGHALPCAVTGWTADGKPCALRVAHARQLPEPARAGVIVWSGTDGLHITGPGPYEQGVKEFILWLEGANVLPDAVQRALAGGA